MDISIRDLKNDTIKPSKNGGLDSVVVSVTHKVLISDTTLRSYIPTQVRKMTPRLIQICGYELCIIPKDMQVVLNRLITKIVTDLQHKSVGRHTRNSLFITTSAAHYKEKLFPYGEFLHDTIKDAAQYISCNNIQPKNTIIMKCDFL